MSKSSNEKEKLKVWLNGTLVSYRDACVPILTHSLQYGSGVFEGIRAYNTKNGPAIFRLKDHVLRFINSAKIHGMPLLYGEKELFNAIVKTVEINKFDSCYIRPFAFYDNDEIGLATSGKKVSVAIVAVPFGQYFGKGRDTGIRCKVSSWRRINSEILPVQAKASGNYLNSIIAKGEATRDGYDDTILLSKEGYVSEGSGENIFLVKENRLFTPGEDSDILVGITRNSVMILAKYAGFEVIERSIHREELYTADEVFFTGTAAEVTPIVGIDGFKVGNGKPGPITKMLAAKYSDAATRADMEFGGWLTSVK